MPHWCGKSSTFAAAGDIGPREVDGVRVGRGESGSHRRRAPAHESPAHPALEGMPDGPG